MIVKPARRHKGGHHPVQWLASLPYATTMNLKHIKAIAFDLDGTLVDSIADLAASANAMRQALGLPPLRGKLHKERYGVLKPIKPQRGG